MPDVTNDHTPAARLSWLRRYWVHWLLVDAVLIAAVIGLWQLSARRPAGESEGSGLRGSATRVIPASKLRVATFNIHGGRDDARDLSGIVRLLDGCDVVGLNEVLGGGFFGKDQAELLGRQLGLAWLYAPAEKRWLRGSFGNAILTCLPVEHWRRTPLSGTTFSYRGMLTADVRWGAEGLRVLIVHVDARAERDRQIAAVAKAFLDLPAPAVLLGDLNAGPEEAVLKPLLESPGVINACAAADWSAVPKRLDYILVRGLGVLAAGVDAAASDHPRLWADLHKP